MFTRAPLGFSLGVIFLVMAFSLSGIALADVSDQELSTTFNLQRKVLRDKGDAVVGVRLWNDQHEILLFADMNMATIDGQLVVLNSPVTANAGGVNAPSGLVDTLRDRLASAAQIQDAPRSNSFTVCVDAGHGGNDWGATGATGKLEKNVNLQVALLLAEALRAKGMKVVMTRSVDTFVELDRRAQIANEANCDLFVSVHANSMLHDHHTHGCLVMFPADEWDDASKGNVTERAQCASREGGVALKNVAMSCPSRTAATTIYAALLEQYRRQSFAAATAIRAALCRNLPIADRGSQKDWRGLRVLRKTYCPAVLVEMDYLSNPVSETRLANRLFQRRLAQALGDGIENFLKADHGPQT